MLAVLLSFAEPVSKMYTVCTFKNSEKETQKRPSLFKVLEVSDVLAWCFRYVRKLCPWGIYERRDTISKFVELPLF